MHTTAEQRTAFQETLQRSLDRAYAFLHRNQENYLRDFDRCLCKGLLIMTQDHVPHLWYTNVNKKRPLHKNQRHASA